MSGLAKLATGLVLPPWLNFKLIGAWLAGLALLGLFWSWDERGHQVVTLKANVTNLTDWQTGLVQAVEDAQQPDPKTGKRPQVTVKNAVQTIGAIKSSYTNAVRTLDTVTATSLSYKARADAADIRLANTIASYKSQFALANRTIVSLQNRAAVPVSRTCDVISSDTNVAWDGWKGVETDSGPKAVPTTVVQAGKAKGDITR